jgi:NAD(P)-dependent dehydrogenase (short-subunit alcohol dehydrogenase family)
MQEGARMERFKDKSILVAGGTGGLGRAVSLAFLDELAKVAATYQRPDEFAALKKAAGTHASSLEGYKVDVTNEAAVRQLTQDVNAKYGRLDVLVNAVGAYAGGTPLWETDPKVFEQMLALNLRSGFVLLRAVVPVMLKQSRGAIVSVASQAAVNHAAGAAAYAASKAAAVAMIDCLAADLKGTGARANSILPSIIDTEANRRAMPNADFTNWPKPEDIARVILFLCSDDAKLINGAAVPVYGNT